MVRSLLTTRFVLPALLAAGVLCAAGSAGAQVDRQALEMLRRCVAAEGAVNFSGIRTVVVFENGVKVEGYEQQVYEKAPGKQRVAVIMSAGEPGRLFVSNGLVQWHYLPDRQRAVRRELPPPSETRARRLAELDELAERTRIQYLGTQTIAGRTTHVIVVSTTGGSPMKKNWVDGITYVVLKTQRFDSEGRVKLSMYYTAINYAPQYTDGMFDFVPPAGATVREASDLPERIPLAEAEGRAGFKAVLPGYLPPGYTFQSDSVAVIPMHGRKVLWLEFSSGADSFSMFQRLRGVQIQSRQQGRCMEWSAGPYSFTLISSVSCDEMCKIRDSVRP